MRPVHLLTLLCSVISIAYLSACSESTADTSDSTSSITPSTIPTASRAMEQRDPPSYIDIASLALTQLTGRYDSALGYPRAAWSASAATIRVTGNELAVQLNGAAGVYFNVLVDGIPVSSFSTVGGEATYPLMQWSEAGTHDVQIYRRSEGYHGAVGLLGYQTGGSLEKPATSSIRHLEFIGDSLTCGYGIEDNSAQCTSTPSENAYLTYAGVAARSLTADATLICFSGKGMARNYDGTRTDTMPTLYDRAVATQVAPMWNTAADNMDAVIINLGTNDQSGGATQGEFISAYRKFIERIRTTHPQSLIVAVTWSSWGSALEGYVAEAVNQVQADRQDDNLMQVRFTTDPADGYGCAGHTNVTTNAKLGAQLSSRLAEHFGW